MATVIMVFKYTLSCDNKATLKEAADTLICMQGHVEASMKDGYGVDVKLAGRER